MAEIERLELQPGDALAVSWGATMWEIAQIAPLPAAARASVSCPAIAGFDETDVRFQTNEIARRIADASGADVSFLHSPALPSAELRRSLLARPRDGSPARAVGRPRGRAGRHRSARAGDSAPVPRTSCGDRVDLDGAVGDVVSRYFDVDGQPVPLRARGAPARACRATQLRAAGTVVGVAAGATKTRSIVGAARAGLIDVLVTDAATAAGCARAASTAPDAERGTAARPCPARPSLPVAAI